MYTMEVWVLSKQINSIIIIETVIRASDTYNIWLTHSNMLIIAFKCISQPSCLSCLLAPGIVNETADCSVLSLYVS